MEAHEEQLAKFRDALTTKQVAREYPFLNESTLRYLRHKDEGPKSWTVGRKVLYLRGDVEAWLEAQQQATTRGGAA